jgi:hypothetical protein
MHDLKVDQWLASQITIIGSLDSLTQGINFFLLPPVAAFVANAKRANELAHLPGQLTSLGIRMKLSEIQASIMMFGDPCLEGFWKRPEHTRLSADEQQQVHSDFSRFVEDLFYNRVDCPIPAVRSAGDHNFSLEERTLAIYETMMSTQIILAWTALETLAGDLWESAVNQHPQTLAEMKPKRGMAHGEGKALPLRYLSENGYDIKHKMGTILRAAKCNFTTLDGISSAYMLSFDRPCVAADENIWKDADLVGVCKVRNVLVHKAGTIDQEFLDACGTDPRFAHCMINHRLELDGKLVSELLLGLIRVAVNLIRGTEAWLAAN